MTKLTTLEFLSDIREEIDRLPEDANIFGFSTDLVRFRPVIQIDPALFRRLFRNDHTSLDLDGYRHFNAVRGVVAYTACEKIEDLSQPVP